MSTLHALRQQHPDRIPLHLHDGQTFVWHPSDVARLRRDHAICGLMTGTLPLIPQQNVFLGLPLQLCNEEVAWLLRAGAGMLIVDAPSHRQATKEEVEEYWKRYRTDVRSQRKATKKEREATRRLFAAKVKQGDGTPSSQLRTADEEAAEQREDESDAEDSDDGDDAELDKIPFSHMTPGSSADLSWFRPSLTGGEEGGPTAYLTLSSARKAGAFTFPRTEKDVANLCVFENLHAQGFYMGIGLRFGGDFTVYPGDPLRYHAHYSAAVFPRPTFSVSALEVVASGRLGTAVKKSHLFCCVDSPLSSRCFGDGEDGDSKPSPSELDQGRQRIDDEIESGRFDAVETTLGAVEFYSLSWAGFGT